MKVELISAMNSQGTHLVIRPSPQMAVVKNPPAKAGDAIDVDLIPGSGKSPGERNGNPLWYSCLEYPMDRGTWQVTVHGVAKIWTWLSTAQHLVV